MILVCVAGVSILLQEQYGALLVPLACSELQQAAAVEIGDADIGPLRQQLAQYCSMAVVAAVVAWRPRIIVLSIHHCLRAARGQQPAAARRQ